MEMNILVALCFGMLGLALLIKGITSAFKKIPGAGVAIALGAILIVSALVIFRLVPPLF